MSDQIEFLFTDEQEATEFEGTKKEAASSHKIECGRSWYDQVFVNSTGSISVHKIELLFMYTAPQVDHS